MDVRLGRAISFRPVNARAKFHCSGGHNRSILCEFDHVMYFNHALKNALRFHAQ
jgi:hypothetical protein